MQHKLHEQCIFFFVCLRKIFFYKAVQSIYFVKRANLFGILHIYKKIQMVAGIKPARDILIRILIFSTCLLRDFSGSALFLQRIWIGEISNELRAYSFV